MKLRIAVILAALAITVCLPASVNSQSAVPISGLPTVTAVAPADLLPCVHSGTTSKCTATQIWSPTGPIIFAGGGSVGTAAQTYCAQDAGAIAGVICNMPTSSTYGWRWSTNGTPNGASIGSTGTIIGSSFFLVNGYAAINSTGQVAATAGGVATGGYVAPVYTNTGAATANSVKTIQGSLIAAGASTTITLSSSAVFAVAVYNTIIQDVSTSPWTLVQPTSTSTSSVVFSSTSGHAYNYTIFGQ